MYVCVNGTGDRSQAVRGDACTHGRSPFMHHLTSLPSLLTYFTLLYFTLLYLLYFTLLYFTLSTVRYCHHYIIASNVMNGDCMSGWVSG